MAKRSMRDGEKILIEAIIDACGVAAVVEAIAQICAEKAAHIEENWQDPSTAQWWQQRGKKLQDVAQKPFMQDA